MFGWLSRASARASRVKRSMNLGSWLISGDRILTATRAIQPRLASLVNGPHPALAQKLQNFELRKTTGQFRRRGRYVNLADEAGGDASSQLGFQVRCRLTLQTLLQQALGTKPCRGLRWDFTAAH